MEVTQRGGKHEVVCSSCFERYLAWGSTIIFLHVKSLEVRLRAGCKNVVIVAVRKWEMPFGERGAARECVLICLHDPS